MADLYSVEHGRIQQSVVPWCFNPMKPRELIDVAARLKMPSVELISPDLWPVLKEKGMTCAIASSHGFARGFAHPEEHEQCLTSLRKNITIATYDSGHMMYLLDKDAAKLRADITAWLR